MILTAIFSMLSTSETFNPSDLFKVDTPTELREKQAQKAVKQTIRFLEARGITVTWQPSSDYALQNLLHCRACLLCFFLLM